MILHDNGTWEYMVKAVSKAKTDVRAITVYATRTGAKYHRESCRFLRKSKIPMKLDVAAARYDPCKVCKPPMPD